VVPDVRPLLRRQARWRRAGEQPASGRPGQGARQMLAAAGAFVSVVKCSATGRRGFWPRFGGVLVLVGLEERLAVVAAEQEGEAVQVVA